MILNGYLLIMDEQPIANQAEGDPGTHGWCQLEGILWDPPNATVTKFEVSEIWGG